MNKGRIKLFLQRVFALDPDLVDAGKRTKKLAAMMNGESNWMLSCHPKIDVEKAIECDNGKTYREQD